MATIAGGLLAFGAIGASSWNTAAQCEALPVYGKPGTNQERTFLAVKPDGKVMEKFMPTHSFLSSSISNDSHFN